MIGYHYKQDTIKTKDGGSSAKLSKSKKKSASGKKVRMPDKFSIAWK